MTLRAGVVIGRIFELALGMGKKKRRRRELPDDFDAAPPPPTDEGSWSGRKTLLVLCGVIGGPLVLLLIFGRSDVIKAIGTGFAGLAVLALWIWRYIWYFDLYDDN